MAYRETIRKSVEQEGRFVRQSGGRGQYGHVWLRAIPFYRDGRVTTVTSEGRVTRFETDDRWRTTTFTADSSFYRMMRAPRRILAVVPQRELEDLERALGRPVAVLASDRRNALVANHPAIREAPVSGRPPAGAARAAPPDP